MTVKGFTIGASLLLALPTFGRAVVGSYDEARALMAARPPAEEASVPAVAAGVPKTTDQARALAGRVLRPTNAPVAPLAGPPTTTDEARALRVNASAPERKTASVRSAQRD